MPVDRPPRVSVVIPLYNHERYVQGCIASVLNQTAADFEVIIVDDGSTDRSGEVVRTFDDDRIFYLLQDNQGAHAAINRGISLARGEFVSVLNSDDLYREDRLQECLDACLADPTLAAVFSQVEMIDGEGRPLRAVRGAQDYLVKAPARAPALTGQSNALLDLLGGNYLLTTSNLFCTRELFSRVGLFDNLRYTHDYDFFLRVFAQASARVIDKPLLRYRVHESNTIKENEAAVNFEIGIVLARFLLGDGLDRALEGRPPSSENMARLYAALDTHGADRLIMTILLLCRKTSTGVPELFRKLAGDPEDLLRRTCIADLGRQIEYWKQLQEAGERWREANEHALAMQRESQLARLLIAEKDALIQGLANSRSYRIGRALTWPARRLLGVR